MELIEIKKSAAQSASEALDDIKHGRRKVIFVKEKINVKEKIKPKNNKKFLLFGFLCSFCLIPFFIIEKQYEIKGSINVLGKNCEIIFSDKEEEKSTISSVQGDFSIFLKKGIYKIYIKEENVPERYKMPETTPFSIKLSRDLKNIRIYIPNI